MTMQQLIARSLVFSFALTLAGVASARRPPALVEAQERTARIVASCERTRAPQNAGYRDMLARTRTPVPAAPLVAAVPQKKMGDHLVLVCSGGVIHRGSGYRDFPARLGTEPPAGPQIAQTHRRISAR